MMGFFDVSKNQYPWAVANVGHDVAVKNQRTGEIDCREPVAGEYQSPERVAQNKRLETRAIELSNASRNSHPVPVPQPL